MTPPLTAAADAPSPTPPLSEPRASVLVALEAPGGHARGALRRGRELAAALDAELHVLVVHDPGPLTRLSRRLPIRALQRKRTAEHWLRAWSAEVAGGAVEQDALHAELGDFVAAVARAARRLHAQLVLLPSSQAGDGARVTALARAAGRPVLVVRTPTLARTLLAATDLEDESYPVLRQALQLGRRLDARVVAMHNINPVSALLAMDAAWPRELAPDQCPSSVPRRELARAQRALCEALTPVVARRVDTVEAILEQGRREGADLLVVGTRARPWLERLLTRGVAANLVDRAPLSVLVTPLAESQAAAD